MDLTTATDTVRYDTIILVTTLYSVEKGELKPGWARAGPEYDTIRLFFSYYRTLYARGLVEKGEGCGVLVLIEEVCGDNSPRVMTFHEAIKSSKTMQIYPP